MTSDMNRRLNQGRLYFLLGLVEQSDNPDCYYIKKQHELKIIDSYCNEELIELEKENITYLQPMMELLSDNCNVARRNGFYTTNIVTGECPQCLDYIWNGPFHDVCKHCYAARIFSTAQVNTANVVHETKNKLVSFFKNKERVIPSDQKNNTIYLGSTEEAYQEIVNLYNIKGAQIFYPLKKYSTACTDPFRPLELSQKQSVNNGAPPKPSAKPRKPSRILRSIQPQDMNYEVPPPSVQKRKTTSIRNAKRKIKNQHDETYYSATSTLTSQANEHNSETVMPTITFQQPSKTLSVVTSQSEPMVFETQQSASTTSQLIGDPETLTQRLDLARQYILNVIKR
ncbi:hypothetical protein C2G38_2033568 [Gigaspora rosea]|uniref:Uncharacterized protein n=1 Tax=Gigaspora rosea TaxID=44941 RepID=A0A397VRD4_9GLOM|nr:hypothetical protein C2G38_2033568 [Gigaspora rosea]